MASRHDFYLFSRATVSVSVAIIASLACQSDADVDDDGGGDDAAAASVAAPSVIDVRSRDDDPSRSNGAGGADEGDEVAVIPEPAAPAASTAGTAGASNDEPPATTLAFEACTSNGGVYGDNCDTIYVAVKQTSPPRCVQFNIDNCGGYDRQGLGADVPLSWRLASGSIGSNVDECEVGVFYTDSASVADASGTITWNETTRLPTELVMELTLVPSGSAEDTEGIEIMTSEPIDPVACAEE